MVRRMYPGLMILKGPGLLNDRGHFCIAEILVNARLWVSADGLNQCPACELFASTNLRTSSSALRV
jgi:hypothetical protein